MRFRGSEIHDQFIFRCFLIYFRSEAEKIEKNSFCSWPSIFIVLPVAVIPMPMEKLSNNFTQWRNKREKLRNFPFEFLISFFSLVLFRCRNTNGNGNGNGDDASTAFIVAMIHFISFTDFPFFWVPTRVQFDEGTANLLKYRKWRKGKKKKCGESTSARRAFCCFDVNIEGKREKFWW